MINVFNNGNNKVIIVGKIIQEPTLQFSLHDKEFYEFTIESPRLSGVSDVLKVTICKDTFDIDKLKTDTKIQINGQYRSHNNNSNQGKKLLLSIYAQQIDIVDDNYEFRNNVFLRGYVCKAPIYRSTPLGKDITDVIVAVNRNNSKSDYIPVIGWNENANLMKQLVIGDEIEVFGRIQSRNYDKKTNDGIIIMTAYEISALKIKAYKKQEIKVSKL